MNKYKLEIEKIAKLTDEEREELKRNAEQIRANQIPADKALKNTGMALAGSAGVGAGAVGLSKTYKDGLVDGRVKLYHNTPKENISSILEQGLKGSKGSEPNSYTKIIMGSQGRTNLSDFDNKVYLARDKSFANAVGQQRSLTNARMKNPFSHIIVDPKEMKELNKKENGVLKASINYEDFKKLKKVDNPEVMGAKTKKEFVQKMEDQYKKIGKNLTELEKAQFRQGFNQYAKGTVTIEGDLAAKHLVGGAGYKKNSLKEIAEYASKNKGRMAKGVALGVGSAALLGAGAYGAVKGNANQMKAQKEVKKKNEPLLKRQKELIRKHYRM